jgi:hypothetical protein
MSVNRLVYIADDGAIGINDQHLLDIDRSHFDWVPSNVHAVQWYGDEIGGEVEFKPSTPISTDKPLNERITELGEWERLIEVYNDELVRRADAERLKQELFEASRDYWQSLRDIRNYKLMECDWTQLQNAPLTEAQVLDWTEYRQELRDLPENVTDPKPMVIAYEEGEIHPDWPVPPQ